MVSEELVKRNTITNSGGEKIRGRRLDIGVWVGDGRS